MKRKFLFGLLAATAIFCALPAQKAQAASGRLIPVQVDGEVLKTVNYLQNGVTYVPLRNLMDSFGDWSVYWDSAKKEAVASSSKYHLTANPNKNTITVNGKSYTGTVFVERGRTYIPLRTVVTACGGSVEWDPYLGGAAVTSAGAEYDAADFYWLSRIISAESQGEEMKGQIAVGNVVLNRVEAKEFPNSIPAVIFDRKYDIQFTPVSNGTVYLTPTQKSQEAARRVLDGENVVGDALYFYAPALSQGTWINANRTYHMTIGCHRFYL